MEYQPDRQVQAAAALPLPPETTPPVEQPPIPPGHTVHYDDRGRRMVLAPFMNPNQGRVEPTTADNQPDHPDSN